MELPGSFYVADDRAAGRFVGTALTRGPWSDEHQHGGPPSALLAGALERDGPDAETWHLARICVDLLRPVPIGPVVVSTETVRRGSRAQWLQAWLRDDAGEVLARATAVRIRRTELSLPPAKDPPAPALPPPDALEPFVFPFFTSALAYHRAVEIRVARGRWGREPTAAWLRPRVPLVEGRPESALERLCVVADAANGVAVVLDPQRWLFVNPDLTLALSRPACGAWFGLDTHATVDTGGSGLCQAEVHDEAGPLGRSLQTLLVRPR